MKLHALTLSNVRSWLQPRAQNANKGDFGRVLVVGGDYGMPGAVRLTAEAAARTGAGLVTVATRPEHVMSTVSMRPEILCYGLNDNSILPELIYHATVIVIGPGLGRSAWSKELFAQTLDGDKPLLVDADGLNFVTGSRAQRILTPHPGEAAGLLGVTVAQIQSDRELACLNLQQRYGGVIVLKGKHTLIAAQDMPLVYCPAGNPGMASAGMGDLLSGIIAGLLAQGLSLHHAAQAGVMIHATAGDRVAQQHGERGLLASDLLAELPALLNEPS